jgi:hypothetical protein
MGDKSKEGVANTLKPAKTKYKKDEWQENH